MGIHTGDMWNKYTKRQYISYNMRESDHANIRPLVHNCNCNVLLYFLEWLDLLMEYRHSQR